MSCLKIFSLHSTERQKKIHKKPQPGNQTRYFLNTSQMYYCTLTCTDTSKEELLQMSLHIISDILVVSLCKIGGYSGSFLYNRDP
jgi:hypothetical protein